MRAIHREALSLIAGWRLIPHRFRPSLLRAAGHRVGEQVLIYGGSQISGMGTLSIDSDVFVNAQCYFDLQSNVQIRSGARIGDNVRFITSTHEIGSSARRAGEGRSAPIVIEAGAWLGSGVTVLPGITVERGCVVAAGAVVARSTDADGLYAGVPAVRLRDLEPQGSAGGERQGRA